MNRYFTVMIIPEREKGVKSFRIPRIVLRALIFLIVVFIFLMGILGYDYWKILRQIYQTRHLSIENRQLKEQIQLFQMKINTLSEDIERIHTFERKLRIITGADEYDTTRPFSSEEKQKYEIHDDKGHKVKEEPVHDKVPITQSSVLKTINNEEAVKKNSNYQELKKLYEKKIASNFGLHTGYAYTKEWFQLTKQSFGLAEEFAMFDFRFNEVKDFVSALETRVHTIDEFLLDKDSMLKSTPTLIPTRGWITSYYGQRKSPYAGRIKMHEGIDIGAKLGAPVVAPADGVVTYADVKAGFGYTVQIDHGYGVETVYAHNKSTKVKKGQYVKRGAIIALVGNTGYSTGPHVHYEVRINGTAVDPLYYILD